ncbi:DUF2169 domain-containing protein [Orrella sp. JC864]|uniref:DUF2169 family type VI secretion system accessory protein n=1 Tax=Orrella sp. JC864 TaxID=3120298 RepID=UPI0030097761
MRIIKPLRLGLLSRPYQYRGRHHLGVSVLAYGRLDGTQLLPEAELWKLAGQVLDEDESLDLGLPKPCAEFLVSGKAYAHATTDPGRCAVQVQVAGLQKHLLVSGARAWRDGRLSEPEPVQGVPVNWRHAYGGPQFEENPVGIGMAKAADGSWPAPQVEYFDDRMQRPGSACRPASLGAVSPIRPRRFKLTGDYDPGWLEQGFPGLPDTLDPHFFNCAPPDQWFVGLSQLPGQAPWRIDNMHPERAVLQGELPDWRARCFVLPHGSATLQETELRATTAWFFPDCERLLMIYQGVFPLLSEDAAELAAIMPALELADAPRSLAHYEQTLTRRLARDDGALYALLESDLLPSACLPEERLDADPAGTSPQVLNQRRRAQDFRQEMRQRAVALGQDPEALLAQEPAAPQAPARLEDLPDYLRRSRRAQRQAKADALRRRREAHRQMAQAFDADVGAEPVAAGGPPRFGAWNAMAQMAHEAGRHDPQAMPAQALQAQLEQARAGLEGMYRRAAHLQQAAEPAAAGRSLRMRRRVQALMRGSADLAGLDLTGVDLSGLDLSGARCRGAFMEGADLSGARLAGADLSGAVLARARLHETDLGDAVLAGTNLGQADFYGSRLAGAQFSNTLLDEARFQACDLRGARMSDCAAAGVVFLDCDFSEARLQAVTFWKGAVLVRTRHAQAVFERTVWLEAVLGEADFSQAQMSGCAWVQCEFDGPPAFTQASLLNCCVVQSDLSEARFDAATLRECSLREVVLDRADFSGARLLNCDLSGASLRQACLRSACARDSLLMQSDLQEADLRDADLIDALMQKSDFRHADLGGANLFRADISQGVLDHSTRTEGAYVTLAKTLPRAAAGTHP